MKKFEEVAPQERLLVPSACFCELRSVPEPVRCEDTTENLYEFVAISDRDRLLVFFGG